MSNMQFEQVAYAGDVQILKRRPFEGIAATIDFSDTASLSERNGKKYMPAGTPIGADGTLDNTATVVGILLHDVTEDRPQGTLLKKAYINTAVAEEHAGITYAAEVKTALPMVVFE